MRKKARDVTAGNCHPNTGGNAAGPGPDLATGDGLVVAHKAVLLAKVRCLGPIRCVRREPGPEPVRTVVPREPAPEPIRTVTPREPGPIQPGPIPPQPRQPEPTPIQPVQPAAMYARTLEAVSLAAQAAAEPQPVPLSQGNIEALEDMVVRSELKID